MLSHRGLYKQVVKFESFDTLTPPPHPPPHLYTQMNRCEMYIRVIRTESGCSALLSLIWLLYFSHALVLITTKDYRLLSCRCLSAPAVSKRHPWITKQKKMPEHKNNNLYGECHSNRAAETINGMAAWSAVENHKSEQKSNKTVVQTYPLTTQTNRTPYCSILRCRKITPGNEVIAKTLELKARGTP